MHAVFVGEAMTIDEDVFPAREPAPDAFPRFEDERLHSAFREMQRGGQSRYSSADDYHIILVGHSVDYIS